MPATRSRTSTEQPAEVAAEEVKQVQAEDGTDIVTQVPVPQPTEVVKSASETAVVVPESAAVAADATEQPAVSEPVVPAAVAADVVTNGSAAETPVAAETNGAPAETTANGSAVVTNGSAVSEVAAESVPESEAAAEQPVSDAKRKSEVGDGDDVIPDSTDVKKQKVVQSESEPAVAVADEPGVDATA